MQRVLRWVRQRGMRVQYSVYLLEADPKALARTLGELVRLIDPLRDDVRVYPVPSRGRAQTLGRPMLGPGLSLLGTQLPAAFWRHATEADAVVCPGSVQIERP